MDLRGLSNNPSIARLLFQTALDHLNLAAVAAVEHQANQLVYGGAMTAALASSSSSHHPPTTSTGVLGAILETSEVSTSTSPASNLRMAAPPARVLSTELDLLRKEREILLRRISGLEMENSESHVRVRQLESEVAQLTASPRHPKRGGDDGSQVKQGDSEGSEQQARPKPPAGIVHSVQIRTGGVVQGSDRSDGSDHSTDQHQVNIEIKPRQQQRHRYSHPNSGRVPGSGQGVSVVNLRGGGSVDNLLLPQGSRSSDQRQRTGSFGNRTRTTSKLIPGRIVVPPPPPTSNADTAQASPPSRLDRVLSNKNLNPKSRSVENLLFDGTAVHLGLKPANSEMNIVRHAGNNPGRHPRHLTPGRRLRGTTSELHMNRLGTNEKVRVDTFECLSSMPAELVAKGGLMSIKPNRTRISQILRTDDVIDLQRQLLTTVMENEVRLDTVNQTNALHTYFGQSTFDSVTWPKT